MENTTWQRTTGLVLARFDEGSRGERDPSAEEIEIGATVSVRNRGVEADEAELDGMNPRTAARGRAEARRLVAVLWRYIEALADVITAYHHPAGATATFMELLGVHGEEGARRREGCWRRGRRSSSR